MTDAGEKTWGQRKLAAAFLQDAQRYGMSWRSGAGCAFEAVYLYALAALGEQADEYEHHDVRTLTSATEKLGWTAVKFEPAVTYLKHQYAPFMHDGCC